MVDFEFVAPGKVIFGVGSIERIGEEANNLGKRCLLTTGRTSMAKAGILDRVNQYLKEAGVEVVLFNEVTPEPSLGLVDEGIKIGRREGCDLVIGLGGGSSIDVGKAVAGLINDGGRALEYQEGRKITHLGIPFIAIPTTCGTGSEATYNSVLTNVEDRAKRSIRDKRMIAKVVIVDPELVMGLPPKLVAISGVDALSHGIESYTSLRSNPFTDILALETIKLAVGNLRQAVKDSENLKAKENMCLAALLSGLALANSGLGAAHGLGASLGAKLDLPHGVAVSLLLPYVMEYNLGSTEKYIEIARILGGREEKETPILMKNLLIDIGISPYPKLEISEEDFTTISENASSSIKYNPRELNMEDRIHILKKAVSDKL
ncbi:MAG: iron-containing alcohol dehydrogenase [bacterium]|nr:iron-containing alcohol dehydrogenase [bacterium]